MLFQTCMSFILLFNTKEDILKNAGYQTVDSSHWLSWKSMAINILQNIFFCLTEESHKGLEQPEGE